MDYHYPQQPTVDTAQPYDPFRVKPQWFPEQWPSTAPEINVERVMLEQRIVALEGIINDLQHRILDLESGGNVLSARIDDIESDIDNAVQEEITLDQQYNSSLKHTMDDLAKQSVENTAPEYEHKQLMAGSAKDFNEFVSSMAKDDWKYMYGDEHSLGVVMSFKRVKK